MTIQKLYLHLFMDMCNGEIISFEIDKLLQTTLCIQADSKLYQYLQMKQIKFFQTRKNGEEKPVIESSTYINIMNRLSLNEQITI